MSLFTEYADKFEKTASRPVPRDINQLVARYRKATGMGKTASFLGGNRSLTDLAQSDMASISGSRSLGRIDWRRFMELLGKSKGKSALLAAALLGLGGTGGYLLMNKKDEDENKPAQFA